MFGWRWTALMHLGFCWNSKLVNFAFIINNFSHDSVGGQPTISKNLDFESLKGIGFRNFELIKKIEHIKIKNFQKMIFIGNKL